MFFRIILLTLFGSVLLLEFCDINADSYKAYNYGDNTVIETQIGESEGQSSQVHFWAYFAQDDITQIVDHSHLSKGRVEKLMIIHD